MPTLSGLDAGRAVRDLRQLANLTSDERGAQRVCWTTIWDAAREWYRSRLAELPVQVELDAAGNCWATLPGRLSATLVLGGHLDSVPDGGWLDGALGTLGGLEVLRAMCSGSTPQLTVQLVDWADEEGVSFGEDSLGARAACGTLNTQRLRGLRHRDGRSLEDVFASYGLHIDRLPEARSKLRNAIAYLELHIEQGPVLESLGLPLAVVSGTVGVERHRVVFRGEASHAGTMPMDQRRDSFASAARFALEVRRQVGTGAGLATVGSCTTVPGIATAVAAETALLLDQRHPDAAALAALLKQARTAATDIAAEEGVEVDWEEVWHIAPIAFDARLVGLAAQALDLVGAPVHRMASGALHDAAEVQRAGVPTAMLFCQSLHGASHTPLEDTREDHLRLAIEALATATSLVMSELGDALAAT